MGETKKRDYKTYSVDNSTQLTLTYDEILHVMQKLNCCVSLSEPFPFLILMSSKDRKEGRFGICFDKSLMPEEDCNKVIKIIETKNGAELEESEYIFNKYGPKVPFEIMDAHSLRHGLSLEYNSLTCI